MAALEAVSAAALKVDEDELELPGLGVQLRPFQSFSVKWMLAKERLPEDLVAVQPELWYGRGCFHLWPPARGGCLFHEMGLGTRRAARRMSGICPGHLRDMSDRQDGPDDRTLPRQPTAGKRARLPRALSCQPPGELGGARGQSSAPLATAGTSS